MHRLILIEGMIGAGKTTTAVNVARRLTDGGHEAHACLEFDDDPPIRTRAVDLLRARPGAAAAPRPGVGEDGLARDPAVYSVDQWGALAERCRRGGRIVVLESVFLQNTVLPRVAPADPLLVHLRPTDVGRAVERVHRERGAEWAASNVTAVSRLPWARARRLRGVDAVVALYVAWERVVDELLDGWTGAKLLLADPQDDWAGASRRICSAAGA